MICVNCKKNSGNYRVCPQCESEWATRQSGRGFSPTLVRQYHKTEKVRETEIVPEVTPKTGFSKPRPRPKRPVWGWDMAAEFVHDPEHYCDICNKPGWRLRAGTRFCSDGCAKRAQRWPARRAKVFKRDNLCCRMCESKHDLTAHHIVPRDDGGGDHLGNLVTLCRKHHDYIESLDPMPRSLNGIMAHS